MPDDLYERDILVWSEKQATLLRRLARGEGLNEAVDLLKLRGEADNQAVPHWRGETVGFLLEVQSRFSPSMRYRIDLGKQYRLAIRQFRATGAPLGVPDQCPYVLDELLDEKADLDALAAKLG